MIRIVFVCLGNICRSPMAEAIMKKMVSDMGISKQFLIDSKATSTEELGNPIYPLAKKKLEEKGIYNFSHQAQVFQNEDYDFYDYVIVMEDSNIRNLMYIIGNDSLLKIHKLIPDYNIDDPWYTRDFENTYNDICYGCSQLLEKIIKQENIKREGE